MLSGLGERRFPAGDASEDGHSRQAVESKSTSRFSAAIESGYDLALQIDDLAFAVDPEI